MPHVRAEVARRCEEESIGEIGTSPARLILLRRGVDRMDGDAAAFMTDLKERGENTTDQSDDVRLPRVLAGPAGGRLHGCRCLSVHLESFDLARRTRFSTRRSASPGDPRGHHRSDRPVEGRGRHRRRCAERRRRCGDQRDRCSTAPPGTRGCRGRLTTRRSRGCSCQACRPFRWVARGSAGIYPRSH